MATSASSPEVSVLVDGKQIDDGAFLGYSVDRDINQPDHASIEISNQAHKFTQQITDALGKSVEIKAGTSGTSIFKGEVSAFRANNRGDKHTTLVISGLNKMARLARKRKSLTYTDKTDQQILSQVVSEAGLSLDWKHESSITYKHVYQHNQTPLEFLRTRAARLGSHVWCIDTKVSVKQATYDVDAGFKLTLDEGGKDPAQGFSVQFNSASVLKKVTVKGWNPETKELITGEATVAGSKLGSQNASAAAADLGKEETFVVDHPIWSAEEAKMIAKAYLADANLKWCTGEVNVSGKPEAEIGKYVEITADSTNSGNPLNGKYYILGLRHHYHVEKNKSKGGASGYVTTLRVARDAAKK